MKPTAMVLLVFLALSGLSAQEAAPPRVLIETSLGSISIEVYPDKAPITVRNFLEYVDQDLLSGASFYRVVRLDNQPDVEYRIEVVQGGLILNSKAKRLPPIEHETTESTGLSHRDGVISMARSQPGTASSEFFICLGDQLELDFGGKRNADLQGFAAFGRVIEGMDVVRTIHGQPADGQMLTKPVALRSVRRLND